MARKATTTRTTSVRNTAIPRSTNSTAGGQSSRQPVNHQTIAQRAYEIWQSGKGGTEQDNWYRAERELRNAQR